MKNTLTKYYQVDAGDVNMLTNPTRQQILAELFSMRKIVTSKDNLLIFYAGHRIDADASDPSNWLSNSDLREHVRGIKSAHTLLIADVFQWRYLSHA